MPEPTADQDPTSDQAPELHQLHDVEIIEDGRRIASADIDTTPAAPGTARVSFHAESGHLPTGTRTDLVDAVLDEPDVQNSRHLHASVPSGDSESLTQIQQRTSAANTRAAGSTTLIEADLHPDSPANSEPP